MRHLARVNPSHQPEGEYLDSVTREEKPPVGKRGADQIQRITHRINEKPNSRGADGILEMG